MKTKLFLIGGFLLSSDLPWNMLIHGLFFKSLGSFHVILMPEFIIAIALCFFAVIQNQQLKYKKQLLLFTLLFCLIGVFDFYFTFAANGETQKATYQLIFGFFIPATLVLTVATSTPSVRLQFFRAYYFGFIIYLSIGFVILVFFENTLRYLYQDYGVGGALIMLRYTTENSIFSLIMGDANKISNNIFLSMLLAPILLGLSKSRETGASKDLMLFKIFAFLGSLMLIVFFSRLILLLLPLFLYFNRNFLFKNPRRIFFVSSIIGLLIIVLNYHDFVLVGNALFKAKYFEGDARGVFGTGYARVGTIKEVLTNLDLGTFFTGIGVGGFSKASGCEDCGTHNLYLDHFLSSGILSFLILFILTIWMGIKQYNKNKNLLIILLCFVLIAFREFSFAYLNVTSIGGFIFLMIAYVTFTRNQVNPELLKQK